MLAIAATPKQATAAFHFSAAAPTGQTLYYKIIADSVRQVRLTYPQVSDDHENYYYGYPKPTGVLVVPDSVEHEGVWYRVTQMSGQVFLGCDSLTEVTLPPTISEISMNAFLGCTRLTKVNLPGSIEEIQSFAFRECSSLESVDLPEGLRVIWGQAFCLCTSLRSVHLPSTLEEIKSSAFSSCDAIDTVWIAASMPPICGDSQYPQLPAFTATGIILVVPCGTEQAYRDAYGWQDFAEIVADCNGIEDGTQAPPPAVYVSNGCIVVEGANGETVRVFDIMGRELFNCEIRNSKFAIQNSRFHTGIYLVRVGNHPARKVSVLHIR
ncbi:MAG: leucine-rich repeat domain-containing protein [Bacteroidales bacterium]|nr:leucine-rich repeat domain-containing protein [Bacteroidales bacterium]